MRLVVADRDAAGDVRGSHRAALGPHREGQRPLPAPRDDVDHAAHRIGAVEAAHGPANDLDALDVVGGEVGEIELAVGGVVGLDAVDQDQRVVALGTADAHLRDIAETAAAAHRDAGQAAQRLGRVADLPRAQLLAGDDRHRVADRVGGNAGDRALLGGECGGLAGSGRRGLARRRRGGPRGWSLERGPLHGDARQRDRLLGERWQGQDRQAGQACCKHVGLQRRRTHDASPRVGAERSRRTCLREADEQP